MKRPTKKEIKEAVDSLKTKPEKVSGGHEPAMGKLGSKKSSQRIRKQGV